DHAQYVRELAAADIFLHPSVTAADGDSEGGAPTTILEAQAVGGPAVATHHADIAYGVRGGGSALLGRRRDCPGLGGALAGLIDHPERWAAMGEAGRRHVAAYHDIDREALRLEECYAGLIKTCAYGDQHAHR